MNEDTNPLANDPSHQLIERFFKQELTQLAKGHVLEIGSRTRSDISRKELVPANLEYTGFDIISGNNVNVIGDAHRLSSYFEKESMDAVYSMSVFEHLAMPWKAVIEINEVLKTGGLTFHTSHQTWPIHEKPWDYWRFSEYTWPALFNEKTGFEILEAQMGEPGHVRPIYDHAGIKNIDHFPCFLNSVVLCRKIGPTQLRWDMDISDIGSSPYPN